MEDLFTVHSGTEQRVLLTAQERIEKGQNVVLSADFVDEIMDAMGLETVWKRRCIQCEKDNARLAARNRKLLGDINAMKESAD